MELRNNQQDDYHKKEICNRNVNIVSKLVICKCHAK
jgi:hypothetical protein